MAKFAKKNAGVYKVGPRTGVLIGRGGVVHGPESSNRKTTGDTPLGLGGATPVPAGRYLDTKFWY
jgi:hypothetical protein